MAFPVIRYDAATGSDTLASGAGPDVAVTGTNGDSSGVTVTLNGTFDFTGAANDGSDVLWMEGNPGQFHLQSISAFIGGVATCTGLTLSRPTATYTGSNWAVGGYRETLDNDTSRQDIDDYLAGWTAELASGTYVASSAYAVPAGSLADGPITFRAATGATPTLSWIGSHALFQVTSGDLLHMEGLTMTNIVSTSTNAQCLDIGTSGYVKATNCTMRSARAIDCVSGRLALVGCDVQGDVDFGISGSGSSSMTISDSTVHDCASVGVYVSNSSAGSLMLNGCRIYGNAGQGLYLYFSGAFANQVVAANNSIHGNGSDGIRFLAPNVANGPYAVFSNILSSNGGYGIWATSAIDPIVFCDYNAFYNNTSGEVLTISKGANSVTLTADPFADAASGNFTLNNTAGGGAACRGAGLGLGD